MDLIQIRYFLSLAETLNFTRAAEACHVTQPALTKSIQRLEAEMGGPLLLRERALTQLTPLGRTILPLLEQTYAAAERVRAHASSAGGAVGGVVAPLRIGFGWEAPMGPFLPLFEALVARVEGAAVVVTEGDAAGLCEGMLQGELDVAVVVGDGALPGRVNRWVLFEDRAVLMLREGGGADLAGAAVVGRGAGCAMERVLEAASRQGIEPGVRHRAETAAGREALVRAGIGVGASTERAGVAAGLAHVAVEGVVAHEVVLLAVAGRPFGRAVDAFIKLARARDWGGLDQMPACQLKPRFSQ